MMVGGIGFLGLLLTAYGLVGGPLLLGLGGGGGGLLWGAGGGGLLGGGGDGA